MAERRSRAEGERVRVHRVGDVGIGLDDRLGRRRGGEGRRMSQQAGERGSLRRGRGEGGAWDFS